jgi:hypothetical protein
MAQEKLRAILAYRGGEGNDELRFLRDNRSLFVLEAQAARFESEMAPKLKTRLTKEFLFS